VRVLAGTGRVPVRFNLTWYDDQSNATTHFSAVQRLLYDDNVDFILGGHYEFAKNETRACSGAQKLNLHCCAGKDLLLTLCCESM
jgi:hypothetical protein